MYPFATACLLQLFLFCFSFSALSLPVAPDEIPIPKHLTKRSSVQIQAVFSSLKKQYNNKTANLWLLKYKEALLLKKKKTELFCSLMKELAEAPAFPLKQLSLIESYELCPYPKDLKFAPEAFPKWLRFRLAETFYKRRKLFENKEATLEATIYLAKNSPYKDLRVSYLKHALSLVKDQKAKEQELQELFYKEAPRYIKDPKPQDYFLIAEDFRQNRQFRKARAFYLKTLKAHDSGFEKKNLSFKALNRIYKIQKNSKKRAINFRQWSDWLLKENTALSLEMYYKKKLEVARQKWNQDQNQEAISMITKALENPKSKIIQEKALYLRGLIYIQEEQPELGLKDFDKVVKNLYKKKEQRDLLEKVLWKRALIFRNQKNYKQALYNFKILGKISKNPYTQYKSLFWKAKSLWDMGQKSLAKKFLRQLIKKDHFGYYGLLARKLLDKKPAFQKKEQNSYLTLFSDFREDKAVNLIHWLSLFQEFELLSYFLDTQENAFLRDGKQTEKKWLRMISLWIKAKKYLEVFQSLEKMDEKIKKSFSRKYVDLLFPLDFYEEVERSSKKWDIPKPLIFALIRQESAFNVRARSTADAFGLMQLIPSTARQTARKFKIPYRSFRDLYKPSKNIFLGTAYLKSLLNRYNDSFILSLAAYNAGERPVDRWRQKRKDMETLDFIENIPYEETRSYVRLLLRNYLFYKSLIENKDPWFPENLLQR